MFNKLTSSGWHKFSFRKSELPISISVNTCSVFHFISFWWKYMSYFFLLLPTFSICYCIDNKVNTCTSLYLLSSKNNMPPFILPSLDKKWSNFLSFTFSSVWQKCFVFNCFVLFGWQSPDSFLYPSQQPVTYGMDTWATSNL